MRIGKRRVRVPVLVTLGVRGDGDRVVLDVRLLGDEGTAAWRDAIHTLVARHVGIPRPAVIDGNPGLAAALREQWPTLAIQRCTTHKLRNVEAKAPARLRQETRRRLSTDDLCRDPRDGGPGTRAFSQETRWRSVASSSSLFHDELTKNPFVPIRPANETRVFTVPDKRHLRAAFRHGRIVEQREQLFMLSGHVCSRMFADPLQVAGQTLGHPSWHDQVSFVFDRRRLAGPGAGYEPHVGLSSVRSRSLHRLRGLHVPKSE